ncbi:S1 family peptidase [Pseudarthrobacter sp. LT1]|uniref:S1 family peptidase n=1 Tax=Pseudarthrobacter sp. LT1 TaxID=3111450 RepID=UPI002D790FF5|nr:S1 family peptidase [Pseudarthrobacter sp. LT1]WRT13181.1 S1 family peptidase [Pseudarthrobacter sp. LT1]
MKRISATGAIAGVVLSFGLAAAPAVAVPAPATLSSPTVAPAPKGSGTAGTGTGDEAVSGAPAAPVNAAGPSETGLAEALHRDLGIGVAEFNAAGELGRRAAGAAPTLRALPGFVGISLKAGTIRVEGDGPELRAAVDELNRSGPAAFVLVPPTVTIPPTPAAPTASPAVQETPPPANGLVAADLDQLYKDYVRDVGTQGLQAVTYTDGHFVIRTGAVNTAESGTQGNQPDPVPAGGQPSGTGKMTPAQFIARYANVKLEQGASLKTEGDLLGGQGYYVDSTAICSAGFSAFSPAGLPLVLTAGHCARDGLARQASVEPPGWAPASGPGALTPQPLPPLSPLGSFGFSQFGGPGNSAAADGSVAGTDIAVIQDIAPSVNPKPATSTWGTSRTPDPVRIVGTVAPFQGQDVCRSGRTSGWKCGTVDAVGIWMMPGEKSVPPNYDNDLRPVRAFDSSTVTSAGGDSGGPWISGNFAVGTHTGAESQNGVQTRAIAATLEDALAVLPGYQLELFLNKPAVTAPATGKAYQPGQVISGQVPAAPASAVAGSTVRVTFQGKDPLEVPVHNDGTWSFTAPQGTGTLRFTAETVNGYSRSGANSFEFASAGAASPAPPASPAPTEPPASPAPTEPPVSAAPGNAAPATPAPITPAATVPAPADPSPAPPSATPAVVRPPASSPAPSAPANLANTGGNGDRAGGGLAYTGSAGLIPAAAAAAGVLAVGILLTVLVRRRNRRPSR